MLDGDLYGSTIQVLECRYDRLSVGGSVIVDDYGNVASWASVSLHAFVLIELSRFLGMETIETRSTS